jgi:hypothetical protein
MSKQTAVEYFYQQIILKQNGVGDSKSWDEIYEQANKMFEQQIIDAVDLPKEKRWYDAKLYNSSGEQYYNETYKK